MENKKLIIFDFDGVLVNTVNLWFDIHKQVNKDHTWEEYQVMSHGNFINEQKNLVEKGSYIHNPTGEEQYEKALHKEYSVGDILHDAILHLANSYTICIVSSGSNKIISGFIKKENLDTCFSDILGWENHSSKVVKINSLLEKYNFKSEDAVFITDTLGDIKEGNECGVACIGVTWGLHDNEILSKGNPKAIIDNPQDLVPTIENVLK